MTTPIGPYSAIVRAGDWLVCSGQLGLVNGKLLEGVAAQTIRAVKNADALLAGEGASLTDVVKTLVFLDDIAAYDTMNDAYVAAFGDHRPARSVVAVAALPRAAQVEIEMWAYRPAAGSAVAGAPAGTPPS